jgi:hypothetical protein
VVAHPGPPLIRTRAINAYGSSSQDVADCCDPFVESRHVHGFLSTRHVFLPNGPLKRRPLPSAGSIVQFPRVIGTMRRSDPLPSVSPHFVAFAWRYHGLRPSLLPATGTRGRGLRGVGIPGPEPDRSVEAAGSPRFLGNPSVPMPCSWTPVGPRTSGHYDASTWPPLVSTTKAPAMKRFRGSITRPWDWLSTLRSGGHPTPRKTRFRLLGQAWPGGILLPAGLLRKVSEFESHPPSPSFPGAMTPSP